MHTHRAVGFEQQQPARGRQMCAEPTQVVDRALSDHEAHLSHLKATAADKLG
ncbi:hypothetical protein I553_3285 [Mycobacterium xenopi 4042]|uniref:Uncharacterized protein n=1 Tax=Mycobacterium xenopi 4042 TaxID=1299334 RepID=X8E3D1_MYCXE|nr:hypothetical protein I553_3285 [Mycobacterium xenopi 4042]